MNICKLRQRQRGITLVICLIIMMLMTLFAVTSFNMGKSSLQIVGNMQDRNHATDAAVATIETVASSSQFSENPSAAITGSCGGAGVANEDCIDVNGDGTEDIDVAITPEPSCLKAEAILVSALDLENEDDAACSIQAQQGASGISGGTSGNSQCGNSVWEVTAVATDMASGAQVTVSSGVAARTSLDDIATSCP